MFGLRSVRNMMNPSALTERIGLESPIQKHILQEQRTLADFPGTYFRARRFGLGLSIVAVLYRYPGCLIPLKCHRLTIG